MRGLSQDSEAQKTSERVASTIFAKAPSPSPPLDRKLESDNGDYLRSIVREELNNALASELRTGRLASNLLSKISELSALEKENFLDILNRTVPKSPKNEQVNTPEDTVSCQQSQLNFPISIGRKPEEAIERVAQDRDSGADKGCAQEEGEVSAEKKERAAAAAEPTNKTQEVLADELNDEQRDAKLVSGDASLESEEATADIEANANTSDSVAAQSRKDSPSEELGASQVHASRYSDSSEENTGETIASCDQTDPAIRKKPQNSFFESVLSFVSNATIDDGSISISGSKETSGLKNHSEETVSPSSDVMKQRAPDLADSRHEESLKQLPLCSSEITVVPKQSGPSSSRDEIGSSLVLQLLESRGVKFKIVANRVEGRRESQEGEESQEGAQAKPDTAEASQAFVPPPDLEAERKHLLMLVQQKQLEQVSV